MSCGRRKEELVLTEDGVGFAKWEQFCIWWFHNIKVPMPLMNTWKWLCYMHFPTIKSSLCSLTLEVLPRTWLARILPNLYARMHTRLQVTRGQINGHHVNTGFCTVWMNSLVWMQSQLQVGKCLHCHTDANTYDLKPVNLKNRMHTAYKKEKTLLHGWHY